MSEDYIPVTFSRPDGCKSEVFVGGKPAGEIRRFGNDTWTYDFGGVSYVGKHLEIRRAIVRQHIANLE